MQKSKTLLVFIFCVILIASGCKEKKSEILKSNEDIYKEAQTKIENGKLRSALTTLKNVGVKEEISKELAPLIFLATADANFYANDMLSIADSAKSYSEFVTYYADHKMAPYAQFQIGMCYYRLTNTPENDQEQTFKAIDEFKKVKTLNAESPYVRAADGMISKCEEKIAEHEFLIGKFYHKKKAYQAAAGRFRGILNGYEEYPEKEKIYYFLGDSLLKMDSSSEGKIYLDKVVKDFPNSKYARNASEILNRFER
ncbi:MAG: outer membrane protein assembly factor BamD [Acidobacteriota bacterium]